MLEYLIIILLSMAPFFELRGSIPYGYFAGIDLYSVMLIAVLSNIVGAIIAFQFIEYVIPLLRRNEWLDKQYKRWIIRTQKRAHKRVEKYGTLGLALFIGIPIPGSGVWTGALASKIFGMSFRNFFKASIIGVLIAGIVITAIISSGNALMGL